ncbi:hypothetical protein B0T18DRAFT_195314 [Schizothecium vesticola]|uniref:Uncharacterized protein n=1 Tax=Schizothecium vesticola TaxID=314040 RepID=A0AA40ERA8_9PEZI|nr:hypothetical protein B0T18DRAFT_195314 [Schizothecium vesticola]
MSLNFPNTLKPAKAQLHTNTTPIAQRFPLRGPKSTYIDPSDFLRMGSHNYLAPEGFMWPEMLYDDMSAAIDMDGVDTDGAELPDVILPTQTSFDPSPFLCPALESASILPFEEILAQTALGCFPDVPLVDILQGLGPSTPLGAALVESFMIPGQWLSMYSPTSTSSHTSLATSPLEQISPWTTPGPLQASSPVAPMEGHHMFCPPPDLYYPGPDLAHRWPPGQVGEITTMPLLLPNPTSFSQYCNGQDQPWMNGLLPALEPSDMILQETSTATFYPPPIPLPAKNTILGGKKGRQRLTKAGRISKRDENRVNKPAKCPFPECKYAIIGFPNPSNVKKHIRIARHRNDIGRLDSADQARFDVIENPPKWYPCLEEDCRGKFKVYGQPDHLLRHQTTHHGREPERHVAIQTPI